MLVIKDNQNDLEQFFEFEKVVAQKVAERKQERQKCKENDLKKLAKIMNKS